MRAGSLIDERDRQKLPEGASALKTSLSLAVLHSIAEPISRSHPERMDLLTKVRVGSVVHGWSKVRVWCFFTAKPSVPNEGA